MIRTQLGDADEMFRWFFDRWYDEDTRRLKVFETTCPDITESGAYVGRSAADICWLSDEYADEALRRVDIMLNAAGGDWPRYLPVRHPINIGWIESFDAYYEITQIEELLRRSDPEDFANDYLVAICEFGAVLGAVMKDLLPRVTWLASWPYWESSIFDSQTGSVIPVFHWAIKKFSTYGIDDGFAEKLQVCVQMLQEKE